MPFILILGAQFAHADTVTLDDHGTDACHEHIFEHRADSVTMHVTVVTGNVWVHHYPDYFDLRIRNDAGQVLTTGMHVAVGAPAGTVVSEFDFVQVYPFCEYPPGTTNTRTHGYPTVLFTGGDNAIVGEASGSGLVMTFTNSGDGGPSGSGLGVDKTAASQIWTIYDGSAPTSPNTKWNDHKSGGDQCDGPPPAMARYSVHSMLVSLNIEDTPLRYSPPRGPALNFTVTYNQKESRRPAIFNFSNLGPKWTFSWLAYVEDTPSAQLPTTSVRVPGGGAEIFQFESASQTFSPDPQSHATLVKTGANSYERRLPDGSKQVFSLSDGATSYPRRIFMTQVVDPAGNAVTIGYDSTFRVIAITDALGQVTTVAYEGDDPLRITRVTDPFGRFATFEYQNGKLRTITDEIGIQSEFTYAAGTDSIDSLTTPYGTTTFVSGINGTNRWIEMIDPLGGKERVEYRDQAPGIGASDPVAPNATGITNAGLDTANTFYWNKKAMQDFPGDYTKAKITHWLYNADSSVSGILSSEKQSLENRVWFTYAGQPDYQHAGPSANPSQIARVLPYSTIQLSRFEYNSIGKITKSTDPAGRVTSSLYAVNNIDLLAVYQRNPAGASLDPFGQNADKIAAYTYNSLHKPLTETDAAGGVTTYTYNSFGQMLTRTNAKQEVTTYTYGDGSTVPVGYLASIASPPFGLVSAVTSFGYDGFNRVHTVTNEADQYTVTTDYDNLDRKTMVTYPDLTYEEFDYIDLLRGMTLDLTGSRDRLGRWTYRHYNANRQMDSFTDPANRTTLYGWCSCGSLTTITDPNGNETRFNRDLQSRVYQKVFADTRTIDYLFEGQTSPNMVGTSSRLKSSTDALGRRTNYSYFSDDNISSVSYSNTAGGPLSPPTASVAYTYDPNYNRLATMTDGTGLTSYAYYPITSSSTLGAGKLQSVDGPLVNDTIAYTYDELGRTLGQSVNSVAQTVAYDSLGRLTTTDNALGHFGRVYDGVTPRLQTLTNPNGVTANYGYFGNNDDRRLQTLQNLDSQAENLSQFDYTYDDEGEIKSWTRQLGAKSSGRWFEYDNARQLLSSRNASNLSAATKVNGYGYDLAGNRTSDSFFNPQGSAGNGTSHGYEPNNLNQIESITTVEGNVASPLMQPVYDLAGNLVDDGEGKTFEWDAANRLSAINFAGGQRTEFAYDGLGRRVKITEYGPGVTATIQPSGSAFDMFSAAPFTFPAGNYTILFEGLNNSRGDMVFMDGVTLDRVMVGDGSFETPDVSHSPGGYEYNPASATWNFLGDSGIAHYLGEFLNNQGVRDGEQAAFVQNGGAISQVQSVSAGTYTLQFYAAQWEGNTMDQQVRVNVRPSGAGVSIKRFVWCGDEICEERDASGATAKKRFFAEGEVRLGGSDAGSYYYTRDHLGSIREVTDFSGGMVAQYDYDPYGKAVVAAGNMSVDFGYTGHYFHAPSGLNLALYRAYNPALGRWLNRDPIGERGGLNLYGYVGNNPSNLIDPLGEDATVVFDRASGILTAIDNQTGATARATNVFSGNIFANNPAHEADPFQGPAPGGTYLLGQAYQHGPGPGDQTWYHLYGPDGQGGYRDRFPVKDSQGNTVYRDSINLHTGRASDGCVTVTSDLPHGDPDYPQSAAYDAIKALLNGTTPYPYKGSSYTGWLIIR